MQAKWGKIHIYRMKSTTSYSNQIRNIDQLGLVIMRDINRFAAFNTDVVSPFFALAYCHKGFARARYDMREVSHAQNDLACIMPNHIWRLMETSEDYSTTLIMLSPKMFQDFIFQSFSHDFNKFSVMPISSLTENQADRLLELVDQMELIAAHTEQELPHRDKMLVALLAVGYEYINFYRREQDLQWATNRHTQLFNRFCELVVDHYRESREVQFYADKLHLTPKYFSKVIRHVTNGMSPSDWIAQYVAAQAKRLLDTRPTMTIQEIAYMLGFAESSSFCRFFKRTTGITAKNYKK